jgi:hypothetical protein
MNSTDPWDLVVSREPGLGDTRSPQTFNHTTLLRVKAFADEARGKYTPTDMNVFHL